MPKFDNFFYSSIIYQHIVQIVKNCFKVQKQRSRTTVGLFEKLPKWLFLAPFGLNYLGNYFFTKEPLKSVLLKMSKLYAYAVTLPTYIMDGQRGFVGFQLCPK